MPISSMTNSIIWWFVDEGNTVSGSDPRSPIQQELVSKDVVTKTAKEITFNIHPHNSMYYFHLS